MSIIGVTLVTAAVLLEPICIATQVWTLLVIQKFLRRVTALGSNARRLLRRSSAQSGPFLAQQNRVGWIL